ncbi:MAG: selenium metabolism-associated LysR family transcriptional regulator [bacterium]|jgi:DNA-binding transcriptional LysR family regulator
MEFKQLESFVAVARKKSFSKAADILFMSQPAVTSNVQKLESELGVTLIDRKSKNISLTEGGKLFYRYAVEILNTCAKAEYSLGEYKKNIEGMLEICASTIPEQYLLPHIVKAFKAIYPHVTFTVRHQDSKAVVEGILAGRINFGFIGAKYPSRTLKYIDFYDDRMVLITSPQKEYTADPVGIGSLAGEDIVLREEGSGTRLLLEKALRERKLDLSLFRSQTINESLEAIKKMVALDVGISFISDVAVKNDVAAGLLKKYDVEDLNLKRHFSFVYCNDRCLSPLEDKFKNFVAAWKWDEVDI